MRDYEIRVAGLEAFTFHLRSKIHYWTFL